MRLKSIRRESITRILVVGDVMLDRYVEGVSYRTSPESKAPVFVPTKTTLFAGGAANVAMNVVALGGKCELVGYAGFDRDANDLRRLLTASGVEHQLVTVRQRTTVKTRYVIGQTQILRVDEEVTAEPAQHEESQALRAANGRYDAIVLSDYDKGAVTVSLAQEIIRRARETDTPVIADPKKNAGPKFHGATIVKPNASETREVLESDGWIGSELLLVTCGAEGMKLFGHADFLPIEAAGYPVECADVTGAGDTVAAALAVALGERQSMRDSIHFANAAASVVVGKRGTAVATREEAEVMLDGLSATALADRRIVE